MNPIRCLAVIALVAAPAWGQEAASQPTTPADAAWAAGCARALGAETGALTRAETRARTRRGELRCAALTLTQDRLTISRRTFADPAAAARFHRARAVWEPADQPCVAQVRGAELVVLSGPRALDPPAQVARVLVASFAGASEAPGVCLELSLAQPWRDTVHDHGRPRELSGSDRVTFTRFAGPAGTYRAEVEDWIQRARRGLADGLHFADLPLRNHAVAPGGEDALSEYRLGAEQTALHADVRDAAAAKRVWDALAALLAALDDPGFRKAESTVGPDDAPATPRRPGPPVDGALGD